MNIKNLYLAIRSIPGALKLRKYMSGGFNIRTIAANILGIGGKKKQIAEFRVYRSEDKSANDDVLSASESPEVSATKQKFEDLVVDDEESQVAEKLRECCDDFGREKPEILGQSASFLLKLGKLYATKGKGIGIQQKLNFIKSAALIVGAMVRYEQIKNEEGLEISKCEIRKLQDEIQKAACPLRESFNVLEISNVLKGMLDECRVEVLEKFNDVFRTSEESEGKFRRERLEEAYGMSTKHYLDIMRKTAEKCQDIMGKPPCKFTIVGLGSLARKETTLYSDFQHAIVLEDGINESPSFEVMEYFRWYTTIFHIIIIGLGETSITNVDVKSLNDLYSENQSKQWFSDEYTPYGICFDSMMPNACKIPLGRQEPTKNRNHTIELIQPVSQMAKLLTGEEDFRNGYHLSEILNKTIFVFGNQEVYDCYRKALHHMRSAQTEKTFLVQQLQRLVFPNITASHPWFLYAAQERLTSVLSCLANLLELRSQSGFQIVYELMENGAIDLYMYYELMDAVSVGMEIKMKIHHLFLIHKAGHFSHVQVTNLVGEERVVSCYKTVVKYTILLQHQLLGLLRKDGILKMKLFPDETYWENNKIITCRLGMQVLWKEVEFGLGRTNEAIDKYEKHAEISSAEAKFVIRMAYVALTIVFEYTVYLQHHNSDSSLSGELESHCRPFLKFLKDDNQALMYFYSMLFLIHYEQKNFQQAYEDYDMWQQLRHSQQNHSTYRSNHWMDFLQLEVLSQVTVTDDTLERIKQQIAAEADIAERWILTVQYCTVLLKMHQKGEAKKRLQMMAKRKRTKQEFLEVLLKFLFEFLIAGNRITSAILFEMLQKANTSEKIKFISIYNISGMKQEILKQRSEHWKLASDIRLRSTDIRMLQHNYTTSLFEALSLAVDYFFSTKSASLLWSILHSPSVTKPMILDSVLMLFHHFGKIIVASESKDVPISKEGGKIDVGGCAVTFHRGSFDDVSKVHAKSEIDSSKWPPKYICITAMLWIHSERNLLERASVAMKSWCMKNSTYSREIEVHVLHKQKGSSTWDVVARLPLNDRKVFHFDCADFSPYILGIPEDDLVATHHVIEGHVYAGRVNNFCLAFFLQHDLILKSVEENMKKMCSDLQLNLSPIPVQPDDKIDANLNCMNETFSFPSEVQINFKIDWKFVQLKKQSFFHSFLVGNSSDPIPIPFKCEVKQNGSLIDGPQYFQYEWKPAQSRRNTAGPHQEPSQQSRQVITATVQSAENVYMGGFDNTYDRRQYHGSPGPSQADDHDEVHQSQQEGETRRDDSLKAALTSSPKKRRKASTSSPKKRRKSKCVCVCV